MATMITNGTGKGIVIKTGANTMIGSIATLTSGAKEEKTTLQKEITNFVIIIAVLAVSTVAVCLILWGVWINKTHPSFQTTPNMVINAIAILTAFVPTGLPIAVTLSLLLVARKVFCIRKHFLIFKYSFKNKNFIRWLETKCWSKI